MLPRRPLAVTLAVAALAAPAAGCTDSSPPEQARNGRADVTLDDFFISPQRLRAKAGRITFHVTNRGKINHTLRVERRGRTVARIKTLLPGESADTSATFRRGAYKLLCILGNHDVLGMYGTLTVR
jgi:plastocyanin